MQGSPKFRLTRTRFGDGERYPVVLNEVGCPEWYPTLFATARYRNASKAFNTTYAALGAIRDVIRWSNRSAIDIIGRFKDRQFLQTHEIESLADVLIQRSEPDEPKTQVRAIRRGKLERARTASSKSGAAVSAGYAYSRLTYAAEYLEWLGYRVVEDVANEVDDATAASISGMAKKLRARRPIARRKTGRGAKEALSSEQEDALRELAQPNNPGNPFGSTTARRNLLIVMILDELGLRLGELLAIKVPDIDFAAQEIVIPRRHNDPEDPRENQPVAKTLDRRLPMSDELTLVLAKYVLEDRHKIKGARRHPFLLVATRGSRSGKVGAPLSRQAVWKLVSSLSENMPEDSNRVHPHLFRHNAATRMFRQLRARGTTEEVMEQLMSWQFGWAAGSGTAQSYVKSEVSRQAMKAQRDLQAKWRIS